MEKYRPVIYSILCGNESDDGIEKKDRLKQWIEELKGYNTIYEYLINLLERERSKND